MFANVYTVQPLAIHLLRTELSTTRVRNTRVRYIVTVDRKLQVSRREYSQRLNIHATFRENRSNEEEVQCYSVHVPSATHRPRRHLPGPEARERTARSARWRDATDWSTADDCIEGAASNFPVTDTSTD